MLPSSRHDVSCNRSKIVIAASQLSLCAPNTLAMTLGETLLAISLGETASFNAANARHPSADTPRFAFCCAEFFMIAFRSRKEPLSIRVTCPVAFAHDVFLRAGANDRRVPVVQL